MYMYEQICVINKTLNNILGTRDSQTHKISASYQYCDAQILIKQFWSRTISVFGDSGRRQRASSKGRAGVDLAPHTARSQLLAEFGATQEVQHEVQTVVEVHQMLAHSRDENVHGLLLVNNKTISLI